MEGLIIGNCKKRHARTQIFSWILMWILICGQSQIRGFCSQSLIQNLASKEGTSLINAYVTWIRDMMLDTIIQILNQAFSF